MLCCLPWFAPKYVERLGERAVAGGPSASGTRWWCGSRDARGSRKWTPQVVLGERHEGREPPGRPIGDVTAKVSQGGN